MHLFRHFPHSVAVRLTYIIVLLGFVIFVTNASPNIKSADTLLASFFNATMTFEADSREGGGLAQVIASTATLGNYPDVKVSLSGNTTVAPDSPPMSATSINVSTSTNFKGSLEGDPTTGTVHITNAHPAGSYPVTVKTFSSTTLTETKTFTLTVTTPTACEPVRFASVQSVVGGATPNPLAVVDLNADGKQDITVAYTNSSLSILTGNGLGAFSTGVNSYVTGFSPSTQAVGDFNGDGKQDVVTSDASTPGASIFFGDGLGGFGSLTTITNFNSGATSVAVGDFNNDGKQDLVVTGSFSDDVSILLGDGSGGFGTPALFAAGDGPQFVAVGEFNGDNNQDLAVANVSSNDVSVLLGNGSGAFGTATHYGIGTTQLRVTVADFNGDGKQDLAVSNRDLNSVSILLGDGAGNFSQPTSFNAGAAPRSVLTGDFNGDGKQDLAVTNSTSVTISILLGDGLGNVGAPINVNVGADPRGLTVGDFNGDGMQDLAASNLSLGRVQILLRTCQDTPTPTNTPTSTPTITPTATRTPTNTPSASPTGTPTPVQTACPITVMQTDVTTSALSAPSIRSRFQRVVYLITAGEMARAGYNPDFSPSTIGWNYQRGNGVTGSAPLKVYMQNTSDATYTKGTNWATAIQDMTLIHDAVTALPAAMGPFDIALSGAPPFIYSGGGLYVAYDWGQYTGTLSTITETRGNSFGLSGGIKGSQSTTAPPANLLNLNTRPETRLNAGAVLTDAAVTEVYSYGELALGTGATQIKAVITNNGSSTLSNLPVTLNITGAESFTDTQFISSLPFCGGQAIVTFAGFIPSVAGSNVFTVTIPTDGNDANNSRARSINVSANDYSYKYPGTTNTSFTLPPSNPKAALAAKFDISAPRYLSHVKLENFASQDAYYRIVVYGDNNGTPGQILYRDTEYRRAFISGPLVLPLANPVGVGPGTFYVGLENVYVSYDAEYPVRSGSFFRTAPGPWIDFSPGRNEKLNIGLRFQDAATTNTPTSTPTPTCGAPGSLDTSFNGTGKVTTTINGSSPDNATSVALQADGKVVVAGSTFNFGTNSGNCAVVRYNADGAIDGSFGANGRVVTQIGAATSVAIQSDNKIVVSSSGADFSVVRYNTNGTLDTSFNGTGIVVTPIGPGTDTAYAVKIQPDGKILAVGRSYDGVNSVNFAAARYNGDGTLDTSFNGTGKVTTVIGTGSFHTDEAYSVGIQPDGKIVAAGKSDSGSPRFAVVRYNVDGSLDASFNGTGIVTTAFGGFGNVAYSVGIQSDGRIVAAGTTEDIATSNNDFAIARYNGDGALDTSFNGTGKVTTRFGSNNDDAVANSVALQSDGRIVATGYFRSSSVGADFALARYNGDGTLDTSFNGTGKVTTHFGSSSDEAASVAIQPDGRIVAAGYSSVNDSDFAVARYQTAACGGTSPTNTPTNTNTPTATMTSTPLPSISGTITYGNANGAPTPRFVSNMNVSATGPSNIFTTTIFPNGDYSLSGFLSGTYVVTPTKTGGVNGITSFDAARVAQHVAGVNILTGTQFTVADVSGNGTLSSFDAGQVARYVAGVSGSGLTASWIFQPVNRIYSDITTSITAQDYFALLMGEVSGNWTNTGARTGNRSEKAEDRSQKLEGDIAVELPTMSATAEKGIVVPVNVQGIANKGVISYEFDLKYDPSVMQPLVEPVDVKGTVSRGLSVVINATEPGLLRVVVYGAMPINENGVLLNLRFTAVGAGPVSPISFERIMFNEGESRVGIADGEVRLY